MGRTDPVYELFDRLGANPVGRQKAYRELFRAPLDADFVGWQASGAAGGNEWRMGARRGALQAADRRGARAAGRPTAEGPAAKAQSGSAAIKSTLTPFIPGVCFDPAMTKCVIARISKETCDMSITLRKCLSRNRLQVRGLLISECSLHFCTFARLAGGPAAP
jgi:hypothetical protein